MPVTYSGKKTRVRSQKRQREVRTGRHILFTFTLGALIGWILAFIVLVYAPLLGRHRHGRRSSAPSGPDPYTLLLQNASADPWGDHNMNDTAATDATPKRVFCLVLTKSTKKRMSLIEAVWETWASDCDGVMFITDRRLPRNFPSFVPALAAGGVAGDTAPGQYGALKTVLTHAPFKLGKFDFFLLAPDTVFVAMYNLRQLVSRVSASRPAAWGLVTQSHVPGEGRATWLSGRAGILLSEAARRELTLSDCGGQPPTQPADRGLSLCLRRLQVPQRHVSGFHTTRPSQCATPPPFPPSGLLARVGRWFGGGRPDRWKPCAPRAVTFAGMNFITMRRNHFLMNIGLFGITGGAESPGESPPHY